MSMPSGESPAQHQNKFGRARARILVSLLGLALAAGMFVPSHGALAAISVVHHNAGQGSGTSGSLAFSSNTAAHDWLGIVVSYQNGCSADDSISSLTDTANDTILSRPAYNDGFDCTYDNSVRIFYVENAKGGADTVNFNFAVQTEVYTVQLIELSGMAQTNSFDVDIPGATSTIASATSGTFTTAQGNEIALTLASDQSNCHSWTHGSGFTLLDTIACTQQGAQAQYQIYGSPQTNTTASIQFDTPATMVIAGAVFKAAVIVPQGVQASNRSDALSNSQPSATSNHTVAFTTNTAISGSSSTVSFVQVVDSGNNSCGTGSTSITTCNVTLTGVTANSTLLIFLYAGASPESVTSLTDSNGTVSGPYQSTNPTGATAWVYYVRAAAAGSHTVTVGYSAGAWLDMAVAEYRGASTFAPLDGAGCSGTSGSNPLSCPLAASARNDLLVGYCIGANDTCTAGSFFSSRDANDGQVVEDKTATGTGSLSVTSSSTFASGPGGIMGVALQPAGSTLSLTLPSGFSIPGSLDCGDVDAATSSQFNFNWPACQATATAWGFTAAGSVATLTPPTDGAVHVAAGTKVTIKIGSNATFQQQGVHWITNPSTGGTYTISLGGTFGGSGSMLVSIQSAVTVTANVAESLSLTVAPSVTSIKFVQSNFTNPSSKTASSVAFTSNNTAGNLIILALDWNSQSVSVLSVTDTVGNVYVSAVGPVNGAGALSNWRDQIFYAKNIAGGANTVNVEFSGSVNAEIYIHEYSGADQTSPLDVTASSVGVGTTPNSGAKTTNFPNELVFGYCQSFGTACTQGTNFATRRTDNSNLSEDMIATSTGSYSASANQSGNNDWIMSMATFKPAPGCTADDGATVNQIATTATSVPFGTINPNAFYQGCQDLTVSTNAGAGYSLTVQESHAMMTADGRFTIPDTTCDAGDCTVATATTWVTPTKNGLGHTCSNQSGSDCNPTYGNGKKFKPVSNVAAGNNGATINFVQQNASDAGAVTQNSTAFTNSNTGGDLIVAVVAWGDTTISLSSVTDSAGNTYASATGPVNWNGASPIARQQIFYAKNIRGGANTVKATLSAAGTVLQLFIFEYSGLDTSSPLDAGSSATSNSGTALDSGSAATNYANELVFGAGNIGGAISSPGAGFTARSTMEGTMMEDKYVTTAGSYKATATGDGTAWIMQMATFKATQGVGQTLMSNSGPVTNSTGRVKYRLSAGSGQPAGIYTTIITYILSPTY